MNQPDHLEPLLDALDALQHLLSRFDNKGVIIGGAAVSILGRARFTEDVDAVFLLSNKDLPRLLKMAKEEGIEPRVDNSMLHEQSFLVTIPHEPIYRNPLAQSQTWRTRRIPSPLRRRSTAPAQTLELRCRGVRSVTA